MTAWSDLVNQPQTEAEREAMRCTMIRGHLCASTAGGLFLQDRDFLQDVHG